MTALLHRTHRPTGTAETEGTGTRTDRLVGLGCAALGVVVAAVAAVGVFDRGGAVRDVVSPRGERYPMVIDGVYAWNAQRVVAEGVGWDLVTLCLAVPVLLLTVRGVVRGGMRSRLVALGVMAYLAYQYLEYAMTWAFGPLFPAFVVAFAGAVLLGAALLGRIDVTELAARVDRSFPARGIAVFATAMAALLTLMWSRRIAVGLQGDLVTAALDGQTTMVVQALDLGLLVPLSLVTAWRAWRGYRDGYLLAAVLAVLATGMSAAIAAMLLSAWVVEGTLELAPLTLFGVALLAAALLAVRSVRAVRAVVAVG